VAQCALVVTNGVFTRKLRRQLRFYPLSLNDGMGAFIIGSRTELARELAPNEKRARIAGHQASIS
jgi:3-oxoacyl-[acyl-carrier-protein] synthase III